MPFTAGYDLKIERLEYYLSELIIIHDGGQQTPVPNTWLLIRADEDTAFSLGSHNVQSIEGLNFSVGVNYDVNHADPSTYPAEHPLAPKNPSMHWGWNAGYRFAAVEGYAGSSFVFNYQIHALGDENYNNSGVAFDPIAAGDTAQLYIAADYNKMFENVDVSSGAIVHGANGIAITLLANMANEVFSQGSAPWATSVEADFEGQLLIAPNPAQETAYVSYDLPAGHQYELRLMDLSGRILRIQSLETLQGRVALEHLQSGLYLINLYQDGRRVSHDKLSVLR
ncbi:MAG: MbnP family protein [Bacteroidota bacterium]